MSEAKRGWSPLASPLGLAHSLPRRPPHLPPPVFCCLGELAEFPGGIDFGPRLSGSRTAPFSLCPTDGRSVSLVSSLYDELFPHFSSTFAHVGLDETIDVGEGRSQALCQEHGMSEIYLGYLRQTREACRRHNRTMMFWADMIQSMDGEFRAVRLAR